MNKQRRKYLNEIQLKVEELHGDLELLSDEEQEYLDNMPESLAGGERSDMAENAITEMDNALNSLEDIDNALTEAQL